MPRSSAPAASTSSSLALQGFDYIELFVGNVRHAAHYYHTVWGFQPVAFRGPETGSKDRSSIVMRQGRIALVLTGATAASSPVADHLRLHGEGVITIGFAVDDTEAVYDAAVSRGAVPVTKVTVERDETGQIAHAKVRALNGFTHAFVDRSGYTGAFFPGFKTLPAVQAPKPIFDELDHVALAVEEGTLDAWVKFYQEIFGFELLHKDDVATEQTGMNSRVVQHPSGVCKFPIVEPAPGRRKSRSRNSLIITMDPVFSIWLCGLQKSRLL